MNNINKVRTIAFVHGEFPCGGAEKVTLDVGEYSCGKGVRVQPLVSVVLPNYNYARYLDARIQGILNQTYGNIELILLDDHSTDNSVELMRHYAEDPRVSAIIVNDENSGSPFHQWRKGIAQARGKYVWIAEADDEAMEDFLQTCVEALEAVPTATVCYATSVHIDPEGQIIPRHYRPKRVTGYTVYGGRDFVQHNLFWRNYIENASGVVFLRQAYEKCDPQSWAAMRSSGDWLFWFQMCIQGDVIRIHKPLNRFRMHRVSTTAKAKKDGFCYMEDAHILLTIEKQLPDIGRYRHLMRVGHLYRLIRKAGLSPERRATVEEEVQRVLGVSPAIRYWESVNRLLRWLPGIVTMKGDALPDTW